MLISVDLSPHPSLLPKCYQVNAVLAAFPDSPKILQDKETYWEHFLDFWGLRKFVEESSKAPRKEDTATLEGEALLDGDDLKPVSDTVQSMLQKGDDLLAEEEVRLKTCIEALEAEESFLMKYLQPEDPLVGLNINGTVLMASLRVLQFFPDSVLGVTFNRKRWAEQERDLDGSGNYVMDYDA